MSIYLHQQTLYLFNISVKKFGVHKLRVYTKHLDSSFSGKRCFEHKDSKTSKRLTPEKDETRCFATKHRDRGLVASKAIFI